MTDLISFEEAMEETKGSDKILLLGNGFSIAKTNGDFSYANLLEESRINEKENIQSLFNLLNSVDFEEIIEALEHAAKVSEAYRDSDKTALFNTDANFVRNELINVIKKIHPETIFTCSDEEVKTCSEFLDNFESIFTLNYDLLLYWVSLKSGKFSDGFGLEKEENGFRKFSDKGYCSIYNIHGGLHLFPNNKGDTLKKIISREQSILSEIEKIISEEQTLPIFVAEGNSEKKLAKIKSIPYLHHCYQSLATNKSIAFLYGVSLSENDTHIYDALFKGEIRKVYICVFDLTKLSEIREFIAKYKERHPKVEVKYVQSSTVSVWS